MAAYRTGLVTLCMLLVGYAASEAHYFAQGHTIKQVIRKAHKLSLLKQVLAGKANDAARRELLRLYQDLASNTPPRGELRSWREKTSSTVNAAAQGGPRSLPALQGAVNCAAWK